MSRHVIKHIYRSKFDIENLSRLRTSIPTGIDTNDYKRIIVNKPWGYEYLMYENQYVAIWILYLKHNHATSMHCHPNKKAAYIVLSGTVVCSTLDGWEERKQGEGLLIDEGVFHCTRVISESGAIVMEIESPSNKKDLVRLKDEYGRENQGYEGSDKMSQNIDQYEYIDFHDIKQTKISSRKLRNCQLSIYFNENADNFDKKMRSQPGHIICMLQGKIHDINGNTILSVGEARQLSDLQSYKNLVTFSAITYLTLLFKKD